MLVSKQELANLKLQSIRVDGLKQLAESLGLDNRGSKSELVKRLIGIPEDKIDDFIRGKYQKLITERRALISDYDLRGELMKVKEFR